MYVQSSRDWICVTCAYFKDCTKSISHSCRAPLHYYTHFILSKIYFYFFVKYTHTQYTFHPFFALITTITINKSNIGYKRTWTWFTLSLFCRRTCFRILVITKILKFVCVCVCACMCKVCVCVCVCVCMDIIACV